MATGELLHGQEIVLLVQARGGCQGAGDRDGEEPKDARLGMAVENQENLWMD